MISVPDKVLALIATHPTPLSRNEIASSFPEHKRDSVNFALNHLCNTDQINAEGKGTHSLRYSMSAKQKAEFDSYMSPLVPYFAKRPECIV